MRVTKYSVELDPDRKNVLVKENSKNYQAVDSLDMPQKVKKMLDDLYHAEMKAEEHLWLIALDTKCRPIGIFEISHGTVNSSVVSPREICIRLCLCGAVNFMIAHNHPSGDPTPSRKDMEVTRRMNDAGKIMNIGLLDHIIIGHNCYYSFAEHSCI